jgi:two-component system cell cycle response regulator DivK
VSSSKTAKFSLCLEFDVSKKAAGERTVRRDDMVTEAQQGDVQPLILVVEDYPDAREMYAEYLRFSGFRVAEARNGEEALARARQDVPDVVLMDLSLPLMDGWEATRRLKSDPRTASTLVVALTGHALAGHAEGARRAGCDAFVTKPCLPDELVEVIHKLLDARAQSAASDAAALPAMSQPTRVVAAAKAAGADATGAATPVGDPPAAQGWRLPGNV